MTDPRVIVKKSNTSVWIEINGTEYRLSPFLARDAGDALYKAGCDVQQKLDNKKEKK